MAARFLQSSISTVLGIANRSGAVAICVILLYL